LLVVERKEPGLWGTERRLERTVEGDRLELALARGICHAILGERLVAVLNGELWAVEPKADRA